jgi:chitin disaccharide deacetylase
MELLKKFRFHKESETLKNLGFPTTTKSLVVHADDFGLCNSVNKACISAFEKGMVSSGSIMVPCKAAEEAIKYSKIHPDIDLGIHLTLTCEWEKNKWKPVLGTQVPSLTDENGFFYKNCKILGKNARLKEVESELHAQIEKAITFGMKPSHLDSHMFCCLLNPDFLRIYLELGREFDIPVLLNRNKIKKWFGYSITRHIGKINFAVDELIIARQRHLKKGLYNFYSQTLLNLKPGLTIILIHPALDDEEMREISGERKNFNSEWRKTDLDFYTGNECRKIIHEKKIRLTNWQEIKTLISVHFNSLYRD